MGFHKWWVRAVGPSRNGIANTPPLTPPNAFSRQATPIRWCRDRNKDDESRSAADEPGDQRRDASPNAVRIQLANFVFSRTQLGEPVSRCFSSRSFSLGKQCVVPLEGLARLT